MRRWLIATVLSVGPVVAPLTACGEMKSTVDEWVDRFLPEAAPKLDLPGYADDLYRAEAEVAAGKYRAALSTLAKAKDIDPSIGNVVKARALIGLGETDSAFALLSSPALANSDAAARVHAEALLDMERPDFAEPIVKRWLERSPDSLAAHLVMGQLLEKQGRFAEATEQYNWFVTGQQAFIQKWHASANDFENADDLTDIATAVDRWATLTGAYKQVGELNNVVLNMYVRCFDVLDRQHLRSRLGAARFALSRGDRAGAMKYLQPVAQRAPRDPNTLTTLAALGIATGQEAQIRQAVDGFRQNDPESYEAEVLETILLCRSQQWVQALDRAKALHAKHPDRPEALALIAAAECFTGDPKEFERLLAQADQRWPKRSDVQLLVAQLLRRSMQYDIAERLLKTVIERNPWEIGARHLLGDVYVMNGDDDKARAVLEEAYQYDPYNLLTVNFLRLLDQLAQYEKRHFDNVVVYFDPDADPIVGDVIGPFMQETYQDLSRIFNFKPQQKVVVQVYRDDDEFSVRMAGVPGVDNFGVSFGRVLATVAPRRGTKKGNFNWARVLRHELVHTFNEMQTNHRVPRWLTEGMATWQEGVPFRFKEVPRELWQRADQDRLFTVRGLAMAFIRPRAGGDGEQAYTQGLYLCRYLNETYGSESIIKLLMAYSTSRSDEDAFLAATGQPLETIEKDFHEWLKELVRPWNYDKASSDKVAALVKEGEQAIKARKLPEALKAFREAYALQPTEVVPNQRLAYLYMQKDLEDLPKAIEHLKFLHILELQNNRYAKQVSRLYEQMNDLANAMKWAHEATYVDLYDASAHEAIMTLAQKLNRPEEAQSASVIVERIKLWELKRQKPNEKPGQKPNAGKPDADKPEADKEVPE